MSSDLSHLWNLKIDLIKVKSRIVVTRGYGEVLVKGYNDIIR